jgi:SdrD B-like domain/Carboxypeptidase regulatory-like domain
MSSNRKSRRSGQVRPVRAGFQAAVEAFEKRELLTAAPFIQGTAFVDPAGTGNLTSTDTTLPGATVNLYQGTTVSNSELVATTTTDANGNYLITSQTTGASAGSALTPGVYTLVETPPSGYTNTAAGGFSEIDPYSVVNSSSIQVTIEPNALTTSYLSNTSPNLAAYYTLQSGGTTYTSPGSSITPANFSVSLVGSNTPLDASFVSYCVDAGHELNSPPESYGTTTDPQSSLPNGGEIGYLFNQYGNPNATASSFPTSATNFSTNLGELDAGLQIAIWDLLYNSGAAIGNFNLTGAYPGTSTAQLTTAQSIATALVANAVAANAAGKSEVVAVLDASSDGNPSGLTDPHPQVNTQSILAGESFNFGNIQTSINGTDYLVSNTTKASSLTPSSSGIPIANTSIELVNTTTNAVVATTTTNSSGQYSFTGIPLGTYSVIETPPAADTHLGQTSTTSGASTTTTTISPITLTLSNLTSTDNFFETASVSVTGTDYLVGATTSLTTSTTGTALAGTTIALSGTDEFGNAVKLTTTTNASGQYSFTGLNPTTAASGYTVTETPPASYTHLGQTTTTSGANANSSTIPSTSSAVTQIVLTTNGATSTDNFFEIGASVSGTVYIDASGAGLTTANLPPANSGDTPEAGVTVNLYNSSGVLIAKTTTASNGTYSFNGLLLGTYGVAEVVPTGYTQTGPDSLTYVVTDTAAVPNSINDNFSNYMSSCTTGSMSNLSNVYYIITTPCGVSTKVTNLRGNTAEGDTVTAYFTVTGTQPVLLSLVAYEAPTSSYSPSNAYEQVITSVVEGTFAPSSKPYSETVTLPNSFYQVDFVCGAPLTQLELNGSKVDYNYENRLISADNGGCNTYAPSSLSGVAYFDTNGNGTFGSGDTGLPNITVTLTGTTYVGATLNGTTLSPIAVTETTTTSSTGTYSFTGLAPGTYTITETQPTGYTSEIANVGSVGGTAAVGSVSTINLNSNTTGTNYDFGETGGTSISGTKYEDTTGNGLSCTQSPLTGDIPEAGVTIDLLNASTGKLVASTVTAANGTYSFTGLPYGTYDVAEAVPTGQIQTGPTVMTGPTCTAAIADSGFNCDSVGSGWNAFVYNPSGTSWTFSGDSGVSGNGSAFTAGNSSAPQGNQVAFVQCQGSISQEASNWSAGNYQLSFSAAEQANFGGSENFEVLVDGNVVATFNPTTTSYQTYETPSFYVGSGSHVITFQGLDSCGVDSTDFLDNVCVVQHTGQVVEQPNGQAAYYSVSLSASSPTSTNNNFSDFAACDTSAISKISYTVTSTSTNRWGGCSTTSQTYSTLSGNTNPGNTVSVTFTVTGTSDQVVSLVSYIVPYSGAPLSSQTVYSLDTGSFAPGTHNLTVTLPTSAYQVDFVGGAAITQFGPTTSNVSYHSEDRFISSDSDGSGTSSCTTPPLANVQSDIGSVSTPGTESYNNGSYTITASGADFWGTADAGNYVYQTLDGNGEIVARVTSINSTISDPWTKAGVMIRQSLDAGSPQASVFATPGNGVVFQDRETQGGQSNSWSASNSYGCGSSTPVFVKIVRDGNTLTGYDSSNGVNWTEVGTDTIDMSQSVYIGLAVTAHNNSAVATATFNDVSTSGYWASSCGQSLIQSFGGGSGSTCLSSWLAQNYSNLYGSGAGCDNLWGQSNSSVAGFCQSVEAQYGCESLEYQTLSTAIDEYASCSSLGGQIACNAGFETSWCGISSQEENTSGSCGAFGTSNSNPWATVGNLLSFENSQASCGSLYLGNSSNHQLACNVIYQVGGCF